MSFPRYHNYKDSGVQWLGEVPEHWTVGAIKYLGRLNPSKSEVAEDKDRLCSFVPMEKLKTGSVALDENKPISDVIGGYTYFKDGDVLFAKVTPCFENRNMAIANDLTGGIGFGSSEINVLRPENADAGFLFYRIQEHSLMEIWTSEMSGAGGLKRVPTETVTNFLVAAPDQEEQQIIAAFLDHETAKIDALIAEQKRLVELLKEKRQAVISHAVTKGLNPNAPMKDSGVEWLGEVPAHWRVAKLSFRYSVELGKMLDEKKVSGEYLLPYLRNRDVQWGRVNVDDLPAMDIKSLEMDRYTVSHGDLLVCEGGEVGRAAIWRGVSGKIGYQKALHRLRPLKKQRDTVEFFFYVLEAAVFRGVFEQSEAKATIAHLPAEQFRQYRFPFPPLSEQIEIANFLKVGLGEIESLFSASEELVESLQERRSSLISAAVTGKIDVRGWQPSESASPESVLQAAEEAISYG